MEKDKEEFLGLQTNKPLKRIVNPYGGMRMVEQSLNEYGYKLNKDIENHFKEYRKTHNDGVFDAYTSKMRAARSAGLMTGLPSSYGGGRILADHRTHSFFGGDRMFVPYKKHFQLP